MMRRPRVGQAFNIGKALPATLSRVVTPYQHIYDVKSIRSVLYERIMNLVLQGGGLRASPTSGHWKRFREHSHPHNWGTSAGSIVAGLLAIGKTRKDIAKIIDGS
jgi:predicted acylesterase/phospholipase RssA